MPRQLINIEGVDRSFGPVDVLLDINLLVQDGDRIGIVGHNGAGKTTLLNTISEQSQDVGEIDYAPGIRIAYLTQIRDIDSDSSIEEELSRKGRQFQELEEEIAAIEAQMGRTMGSAANAGSTISGQSSNTLTVASIHDINNTWRLLRIAEDPSNEDGTAAFCTVVVVANKSQWFGTGTVSA